ncbi:MAG: hypothetical protein JWO94_1256, partial [Verrucomicrobiaceae bacterium]|nr:hypothetical protein [Verrucomicrobiaceae bacterium]
ATVTAKVYNGSTAAVITGTLSGVLGSDDVAFHGLGIFASPDAGTGIAVTSISSLTGVQSGNYGLTQPTGLKGIITATGLIKPTIVISTPAASAKFIALATSVSVTGTAMDKNGVSGVQVSLDGGRTFTNATLGAVTTTAKGVTVAWTTTVTPAEGSNNVVAQSANTQGNTSALSAVRTFTYHHAGQLTVSRTVPASQAGLPDNVGNVTAAGATLTAGVNLNPKTAVVQLGTTVTLTPTAKTGYFFKGWTFFPAVAYTTSASNAAIVVMVPNLSATAEWVTNPYVPGAGAYAGLVHAKSGQTASNATEGCLKATVTSTGSFTGSLIIDGATHAFAGSFDATGNSLFGTLRTPTLTIDRTKLGKDPLLLDLSFNAGMDNNQITGTVSETYRQTLLNQCTLVADRAAFSKSSLMPAGNTNKGYYTVVIPAQGQANGLTPADFPQGDGVGSITVTTAGVATLSATLADGTVVTASASLSAGLTCPLFTQLYAANGGSFSGLITLDDAQADHDLKGAGFRWFKPYTGGALYPFGWAEGVTSNLYGAKYASVAGTSVLPGLGPVSPANGNAELAFSAGMLTGTLNKDLNISAANVVTKLGSPADSSYTVALTPVTGKFAGTFTHTNHTKSAFTGMVFQKGGYKGGYGFFISGTTASDAPESGGVSLVKKP